MKRIHTVALVLFGLGMVALVASGLAAQEMSNLPSGVQMGEQSLRPYWHVFIAYAIAIVGVLGWVISIGRRMADLEARLDD